MALSVKVLEQSPLRIRLLTQGVPVHIMSGLRRIALEEVPTMAIDTLFILENNSVIHDENLAHRLAMIPLSSEEALEKYRSPEECRECPTCDNCYVRLVLEVKNESEEELVVYSSELKSDDPDVKPVYDNIPIVILGKGQSVSLEAQARLGRGKEHIKWSPATVSTLTYTPVLEVGGNVSQDCIECIGSHFKDLAEELKKKKNTKIELTGVKNTSLIRYCIEKECGNPAPLKLNYDSEKLIWTVESSGSLSPERIVLESIKILKNKVRDLKDNVLTTQN